jgi:PKD domain-containing protein
MIRRGTVLSLVLFVYGAATARPEAVAIDHKAVGCIVVGKYPKMNACFTPTAELARSRVYFRPEGVAAWYYVDMKSDQPCFTGTLPKPGKKLVGKKIEYYVEAQNKAFEPARTAEFDPIVVKSAQECKKNVPVAPFLNNATVAVFPSVPAGFVGGSIGTAAVVGIVGAGAAAAGTAAVVVSNNNNDTTTTTTPVVVNPTTTTTTLATSTSTTTTLPTTTNHPPFAVLNVSPDPPSGQGPLTVTFDLCKSTDPDKDALNFFFDFGDGSKTSGSCLESHTYQSNFRGASNVRALDRSYNAEACVVDSGGLSACRSRTVNATNPPPPPACPTPTASITAPPSPTRVRYCTGAPFIRVTADTTNTTGVQFCATGGAGPCSLPLRATVVHAPTPICTTGTASGNTYTGDITFPSVDDCYSIVATASNACGATAMSAPVIVFTENNCFRFSAGEGTTSWSSDLDLDGGQVQVVVNGTTTSYAERGRSVATARLKDGENRVEARVVDATGKPGTWTIEISASEDMQVGSIRVLAGDVQSIAATRVTFRLRGTPGERVVFSFLTK